MRLRHPDGTVVHVACRIEVAAGDIVDVLDRHAEPVRVRLGLDRLALGMWLPAGVVTGLAEDHVALRRLRRALGTRGLDLVTMDAVHPNRFARYRPDWTDPRRIAYTLACARLLTELLPDDVLQGSIGTLPLGLGTSWTPARAGTAHRALGTLADGLAELRWDTGRRVRVGLVPEPGCVVDTSRRAVGCLSTVDNEWVGVALDTGHLAATPEPPARAVERLARAYVPVVTARIGTAAPAGADTGATTVDVVADTVGVLFDPACRALTDHVEVGARVAPGPGRVAEVAAEAMWTRDRLVAAGLKVEDPV